MNDLTAAKLLVSVGSAAEACAALCGGAAMIDVKDPAAGALGCAPRAVVQAVLDAVAGRVPVSAALGELAQWDNERWWRRGRWSNLIGRLAFVKMGLAAAGDDWPHQLETVARAVGARRFVACAYADWQRAAAPPTARVIDWAADRGVAGVLVDTCIKDGRGLLCWCDGAQLAAWADQARGAGLMMALAGSIGCEDLAVVAPVGAPIVAVRGAVCGGGDRRGTVEADRVAQMVAALQAGAPAK